jgi:hypothetical protein
MQLIEAALAFAITMLALSLVVSSFVEIIHRICSMREEGLKHVLRQMFDQVLAEHVESADPAEAARKTAQAARDAFVAEMSANRAPMGAAPRAAAAGSERNGLWKLLVHFWQHSVRLWNGRALAAMTPAEFMERLGSTEVGHAIAKANIDARKAAEDAGVAAAEAGNIVLKDVAQKFEAFGKEASVYFEGRARLLSVIVAMALAFLAHVDAVDLFKTYLRDPNARAKVIEQTEAVTAQYKAAEKTIETLSGFKATQPAAAPPAEDSGKTAEEKAAAQKKEDEKKAADAKLLDDQIEALKKDALATISNARASVKQFTDLGVPLGWTSERVKRADMWQLVWTCKDSKTGDSLGRATFRETCHANDTGYDGATHTQYVDVWLQVPKAPVVWFYLFLGGLLVGLGSPFWYKAVTSLTNLRNGARGTASADAQTRAAVVAAGAGTIQPVTPVDAFRVSHAAKPRKAKEG